MIYMTPFAHESTQIPNVGSIVTPQRWSTHAPAHVPWIADNGMYSGAVTPPQLLTWLNRNAGSIALASFVAFAAAGVVDALVYQWLRRQPRNLKINGSNIASAAVDSLVFPYLAFGGWLWLIVVGQFAAKVGGGFVWSLILQKRP